MHDSRNRIPTAFVRSRTQEVVNANERRLLDWVRRHPGETRARIGEDLDLSAQSVSRITETLRTRGFLHFGERIISGRGQPSVSLDLVADAAYAFGISIMTHGLSVVLVDFAGREVFRQDRDLAQMDRRTVLATCSELLDTACREQQVPYERVFGLGVAFSGFFVGEGRRMNPLPQLEDFALIDIEQLFAEQFDRPVWTDNDGNCAAVGESLMGVGLTVRNFGYIYFSSGLGGGLVLDGKPVRGTYGNAGEYGAVLRPDQFEQRPTLELLRATVKEAGGPRFDSLPAMLAQFDIDWPGVDDWIECAAPHISAMVSAIGAVVDPEVIVLGGSLPHALGRRLIPRLQINNIERRGLRRPEARIELGLPGENITALGAAALPLKDTFFV